MNFTLLSYPITENTPLYGSTPLLEIQTYTSVSNGDSANSYIVKIHNHYGTHIECANHFIADGKRVMDYRPADYVYQSPLILDIPKREAQLIYPNDVARFDNKIKSADIAFFRTGFFRNRHKPIYKTHNPGISTETVQYLRSNFSKLRAIGIDAISISSFQHRDIGRQAHREAFKIDPAYGEPLLIIEDVDLTDVGPFETIIVSPMVFLPIDASPAIVIGIKGNRKNE